MFIVTTVTTASALGCVYSLVYDSTGCPCRSQYVTLPMIMSLAFVRVVIVEFSKVIAICKHIYLELASLKSSKEK